MYLMFAIVLRFARWFKRTGAQGSTRLPRPYNTRWVIDLTLTRGPNGRRYWLFGIIEYASRALLVLIVLSRKSAAALAQALVHVFHRFGAPRSLVTDNEGPFRSDLWKRLLARHGVQHQRIEPYSPWQNGRIERFFGTLKPKLRRLLKRQRIRDRGGLQRALNVFRHWYNHIRPHQALGITVNGLAAYLYLTPAEAWWRGSGREFSDERGIWFEAWSGILRGYAWRR